MEFYFCPLNATLLHWHRFIQSLVTVSVGFFIFLQKINLFFQICGNAVNLVTFFIKKICDSFLLFLGGTAISCEPKSLCVIDGNAVEVT